MDKQEGSEVVELKGSSLIRSRSSLYEYITKGPDEHEGEKERFQSDLNPYRREQNALLALVKGTRNPKRPSDLELNT